MGKPYILFMSLQAVMVVMEVQTGCEANSAEYNQVSVTWDRNCDGRYLFLKKRMDWEPRMTYICIQQLYTTIVYNNRIQQLYTHYVNARVLLFSTNTWSKLRYE